jgi:hypothetical protein
MGNSFWVVFCQFLRAAVRAYQSPEESPRARNVWTHHSSMAQDEGDLTCRCAVPQMLRRAGIFEGRFRPSITDILLRYGACEC